MKDAATVGIATYMQATLGYLWCIPTQDTLGHAVDNFKGCDAAKNHKFLLLLATASML